MGVAQYFSQKNQNQNALKHFKTAENFAERSKTNVFIWEKISRVFFCPLVPPSWIVQNVTPRELSRRSIPPISMVTTLWSQVSWTPGLPYLGKIFKKIRTKCNFNLFTFAIFALHILFDPTTTVKKMELKPPTLHRGNKFTKRCFKIGKIWHRKPKKLLVFTSNWSTMPFYKRQDI